MTLQELREQLERAVRTEPENAVAPGVPCFESPLLGCAGAADPLFARFREDARICGPAFRPPELWLPGAKSVLVLFLPYTAPLRESNRTPLGETSPQWLYGRIEGHAYLVSLCRRLCGRLEAEGFRAVIPTEEPDFRVERDFRRPERQEPAFVSSWSERHAAFAAGLGTFSLAKHLITEKGCCGRLISLVTDAPFPPTPRPYTDPYEYCSFCGACVPRCPVEALSGAGKDVKRCSDYIDETAARYDPRYGCGKCQLSVPCETGIPAKRGK